MTTYFPHPVEAIMLTDIIKRLITLFVSCSLLFTSIISGVSAAMIGTDDAVNREQRAEYISDINGWLERERVRDELVNMGVDPGNAAERVAALTDQELRTLHGQMESLPAGAGLLEVIGIVFLVLLILELVGVTHIFSRI
jgi:hypothetical protein